MVRGPVAIAGHLTMTASTLSLMKILFTRFPLESALGGAEIQTSSLMKGLNERGHAVAFLGSCPVLLDEIPKLKIPNARLEIGPPAVTKWSAVSFAWRKKHMQLLLENALNSFNKLDAIVMLSLTEKLLMTEWAAKKGIKVFWVEHDRIGPWLTKNPWLPMLKRQSRFATTITVSELSRKMYVELGWDEARVIAIPNGIDLSRFSRRKIEDRRAKSEKLHAGCVARLSREKGVDVLIDAVKGLDDVSLTIVGTGPESEILSKRSNEATSIRILPHVDNLGDFYHSLDILILPSREHDPFGMVAAEAMLLGVPVIVTDACGIAGYLHDGNDALIAKANSAASLRDAILKMKDGKTRAAIAKNGRSTAEKTFSLDRMIGRYEELLKN